ncbi:MAG: response regulator, partial [Bacteroidota bacterium]
MKKVVIVDDEAPARALVKQYLGEYPELIIVGECNNGVDALKVISEFKPDLVFMDVQMPGMNGFETCRQLKADETTANIPIIFMTALADKTSRVEGLSLGAVDY